MEISYILIYGAHSPGIKVLKVYLRFTNVDSRIQ